MSVEIIEGNRLQVQKRRESYASSLINGPLRPNVDTKSDKTLACYFMSGH